jgi:GT2 family glycosyltransferase
MNQKISAVIPTLGGFNLKRTIQKLNEGVVSPDEIILSIPKNINIDTKISKNKKVKIIRTSKLGQVPQRIEGFKIAKHSYVLQLDDDILLNKFCLKNLLNFLKFKKKASVSPLLVTKRKGSNFDKYPKNFLYKIYHYLLNGDENFVYGKISKSGVPYNFSKQKKEKFFETEWLPGGCILHKKENLILKNYFPIKSQKAFCEDLIHSHELKKNKIKLYLNLIAKAEYDDFEGFKLFKITNFFENLKNDYICRFYFIKLSKKSLIRMHIYYLFLIFRYFFIRIKG